MPSSPSPPNWPTWREFERLVARIEEAAAGAQATVKSPDRVRSLLTGRKREVDATIRSKLGTVDVLVTIECRKRRAAQDVTWLEQLASKKQAIGAWRTIAVASSAFSADAVATARHYGIELRVLSSISDADVHNLFLPSGVVHVFKHVDLFQSPEIEFDAEAGDDFTGAEGVGSELATATVNARVFITEAGEAVSFNDLWLRADDQHKLFDRIPSDDKPHRCVVTVTGRDVLMLKTRLGLRRVRSIKMPLLLRWKHEHIPLASARVVAYADPGSPSSGAVHVRAEFESKEAQLANVRFGFQFEQGSEQAVLSLQILPGDKK